MSVEQAHCIAMAYELHRLLGELFDRPEHGAGSCVEDAWNHMDDVIGLLEPDEDGKLGERGHDRTIGPEARPAGRRP